MSQLPFALLDEYLLAEIKLELSVGITVPELEKRLAHRVRSSAERLLKQGKVERSGLGNNGDVYRYSVPPLKLRRRL